MILPKQRPFLNRKLVGLVPNCHIGQILGSPFFPRQITLQPCSGDVSQAAASGHHLIKSGDFHQEKWWRNGMLLGT
jgi:hypothetical protein